MCVEGRAGPGGDGGANLPGRLDNSCLCHMLLIMKSWHRWVLWLPVVLAFALVMTIGQFGFTQLVESPATVVFGGMMLVIALVQGLLMGLVAVVGARIADRVCRDATSQPNSLYVALLVHALVVGGAVAVAFTIYLNLAAPRNDSPTIVAPVIIVAIVAAVSGASSAWGRRRTSDA